MTPRSAFLDYLDCVHQQLRQAAEDSATQIATAAEWISGALANCRPLYLFGASHAGLLAQDLFYRAGGLVPIEPILPAGLMLNERPVQRTSRLERLSGFAATFMADLDIGDQDVLLVISVSGRNAAAIEACQLAQERGARAIALTSLRYSTQVQSRSGSSRLFEVADLVVDLPAVYGDAVLTVSAQAPPVGPTSTAVGSAILHGLMCEVAARLDRDGITPPVWASGNRDDSASHNAALIRRYRHQITYTH